MILLLYDVSVSSSRENYVVSIRSLLLSVRIVLASSTLKESFDIVL